MQSNCRELGKDWAHINFIPKKYYYYYKNIMGEVRESKTLKKTRHSGSGDSRLNAWYLLNSNRKGVRST